MIKTVLVPLDGSEAAETAIPYAELIASRAGANLHLLTAVQEGAAAPAPGEALTYLDERADDLRSRSLSCSREVVSGDEAEVILAEADAKGADLIAISTHGRSGLKRWVLGSVAQKVLHGTPRPLLLVRSQQPEERQPPRIDRIIVPLDGSEVSRSILPYVEELAEALGAGLILYNAVPPLHFYSGSTVFPGTGAAAAEAQVGDIVGGLFDQGQLFLAEVAEEIEARGRVTAETVVTIGHPVDEVVRVAQEAKVGLIAMATHGRSGVDRWVMGSVADGVVRRSSLPCLLVRPKQVSEHDR